MIDRPIQAAPDSPKPTDGELRAFEHWLREDLTREFGAAKDEQLPEEWLQWIVEA